MPQQALRQIEQSEVGVVPWGPLMHFAGSLEPLFRRCRDRGSVHGTAEPRDDTDSQASLNPTQT